MLGLGISKSAQGVKSGIVKLLSSLKRRAEYFENKKDSKSEIKVLKDYELLDKATILLTPTATSDALVHSVKTYTGDELATNGDFSNGTTDWEVEGYASRVVGTYQGRSNVLKVDILNTATASRIRQPFTYVNGATYKIIVNVYLESGTFRVDCADSFVSGNFVQTNVTGSWLTLTAYFTAISSGSNYIWLRSSNAVSEFYVENISIIDVSSDFDFDRASSATRINSDGLVQDMQSITDPELVLNGDFEELGDNALTAPWVEGNGWSTITDGISCDGSVDGGHTKNNVEQTDYNGKTFLLTYTLSNVTDSSTLKYKFGGGALVTIDGTNGTHSVYITNDATVDNFQFVSSTGWAGDITNISLKQVDPNNRWSLTSQGDSTSTITDKLTLTCDDGDNVSAAQSYSFTDGNTYKLSFDLTGDNQNKNITIRDNSGATGGLSENISLNFTGTETKTFIFTANANSNSIYTKRVSSGTYSWSIDNVSLKDITFSTDVDLARINYDSNGENGHILLEPTSTNLVTYSEDIDSLDNGVGEVGVNSTLTYESDVVAPDGSLGVYRIQMPPTASTYLKVTGSVTAQSMSVWVKAKTVGTNNQFTLYRGDASDIKTATGDWQRFEHSWSNNNSDTYYINNDGDTYTSDLYVWGIQVENLPYTTSYIPTLTGSTVTRAAETLNGSGNSTLINSTEGVLYAEIAALAEESASKRITISDGSLTNRITLSVADNTISGFVNVNNVTQYTFFESGQNTTSFNKIAVKYKANDFALWINGVEYDVDTSGSIFSANTLNVINFANATITNNDFYGKCKALAVFNEALTDDELELLTGVTNYGSFGELASANGYTII